MQVGKEIRSLTGLRGVAALHVMVFHYLLGLPFSSPATTVIAHGYLEVDLFFVLSGFVMALNYAGMFEPGWSAISYIKFLGRRIARVYPLYFVTTLGAFILVTAGLIEGPRLASVKVSLVTNLMLIQSWGLAESLNPPGWSISTEWAAYLLFPLLATICLFGRRGPAWCAGVGCIAMLVLLSRVPDSLGHQPKPNAFLDLHDSRLGLPVLRCLSEFTLGLLAFRIVTTQFGRNFSSRRWLAPTLCLTIIMLLAIPGADLPIVLLFPLLIISLTSGKQVPHRILSSRPVEFLGQISYSIYLVHDLMGGLMGWVHGRIEGLGLRHGQIYAAIVGMLLTFPCAYLAYRLIEIPGRRCLRRFLDVTRPFGIVLERIAP